MVMAVVCPEGGADGDDDLQFHGNRFMLHAERDGAEIIAPHHATVA
jgi:hypothetical protein